MCVVLVCRAVLKYNICDVVLLWCCAVLLLWCCVLCRAAVCVRLFSLFVFVSIYMCVVRVFVCCSGVKLFY